MAGYAARTRPSQGVMQEIFAKALALEDGEGNRAVLVTTDLLGFPAEFVRGIAENAAQQFGLSREGLFFNASHTHAGPALAGVLDVAYVMTPEQKADVVDYTRRLQEQLVELVGRALEDMRPARLSYGRTEAGFAVNRRVEASQGYVIGANRLGPVDHEVPVLAVDDDRGVLQALVFGYSCHNTTLRGDNYYFHGDYAGSAQQWLEKRHPGITALFVTGTAGDANPYPRGTLQLAEEHGRTLAKAVEAALTGPLQPVGGPLKSAFEEVSIAFSEPPSRSELQARLQSQDVFLRRHAGLMLDTLEKEGGLPAHYPYPVQVWQFGEDLTWVGLAGEVVVDYSIRLRRELKGRELWVAGYCNDVFAYIPSRRVRNEGGYEAVDSAIYYGQPAPFSPSVEDAIVAKVQELVRRLQD